MHLATNPSLLQLSNDHMAYYFHLVFLLYSLWKKCQGNLEPKINRSFPSYGRSSVRTWLGCDSRKSTSWQFYRQIFVNKCKYIRSLKMTSKIVPCHSRYYIPRSISKSKSEFLKCSKGTSTNKQLDNFLWTDLPWRPEFRIVKQNA